MKEKKEKIEKNGIKEEKKKISKVAISARPETGYKEIEQITDILLELGAKIEPDILKADLVISVGGDGTFIRSAQKLVNSDVLITGINYGKLGFLTEIDKEEDIMQHLSDILLDNLYYIQKYNILKIKINDKYYQAVNDIAFLNNHIGEFEVYIDDTFVYTAYSDGLIVSSPLGSTGYSLTAGGPIIFPTCNVLLLTLICPLTLSYRPIIINDNVEVKVKIPNFCENSYQISIDGDRQPLKKESVSISTSDNYIKVLHHKNKDIYSIYRNKLGWHRQ